MIRLIWRLFGSQLGYGTHLVPFRQLGRTSYTAHPNLVLSPLVQYPAQHRKVTHLFLDDTDKSLAHQKPISNSSHFHGPMS
jgi:hypothetical protein